LYNIFYFNNKIIKTNQIENTTNKKTK